MMERSRSRQDPLSALKVGQRELGRDIEILANNDHSLFDWVPMTLVGAWVPFGGAEDDPGYWRDSAGIVRFRGLIKSGVVPSAFTTLPQNFRPAGNRRFPLVANNGFGLISILASGVCTVETGSNVYVDLAAINFRAEL